eukprot:717734_1
MQMMQLLGLVLCLFNVKLITGRKSNHKKSKKRMHLKDLSIGDHVFDGNDFTKIYFIQHYDEMYLTNMYQIKYGDPALDNAITVTPAHLLYRDGEAVPVISDDINIGDDLFGFVNTDMENNYTVYDIQLLNDMHPINPITMSGHLMVNNIKTSVFSHSFKEHQRLQNRSKIFRWISENVNDQLASSIVNFYYNTVYKQM